MMRRPTRPLQVGSCPVGGTAPVSIQSMTNTDTRDAAATLAQIAALAESGCDIVRVAIPDQVAAEKIGEIVAGSPIPVIGDIHFDYRLALTAIRQGIHGIRINPGNIGAAERVRQVAEAAGNAGIPLRVGANSGSLAAPWRDKLAQTPPDRHDELLAEALCAGALEQCRLLEEYGFRAIKVSLKASSVPVTVAAYRKFASRTDYPLHLGVTEAGTPARGVIKSAIGIGALLLDGIGDTIRVSLTASPLEEIPAARRILESCGVRDSAPEVVACPTCGRTAVNLIAWAEEVEAYIAGLKRDGYRIDAAKVAVMGCAVNGPGEARDADFGLAGGRGEAVLFRHGEIVGKFPERDGVAALLAEIRGRARKI